MCFPSVSSVILDEVKRLYDLLSIYTVFLYGYSLANSFDTYVYNHAF